MIIMKCLNLRFMKIMNITPLFLTIICGMVISSFPSYGSAGKYLVAAQAVGNHDFDRAAKNYRSILDKENLDTSVLQEALIFSVLANDLKAAWRLSSIVEQKGLMIPSAGLIALAKGLKDKDFKEVQSLLIKYEKPLPKFLISFVHGWLEITNGNFESGIEIFTNLDGKMGDLANYNCSLAYAMRGEFSNSVFYLNKLKGKKLQFDEQQLRAQAQIYSNNDDNDEAILILEIDNQRRNNNLFKEELQTLNSGKTLKFNAFKTSADALASVFYLMGNTGDEKKNNLIASIFYIQLAEFMSAEKDYYNLRLAEIFTQMQAFRNSIKKYEKISIESPFYLRAQLGMVDTLVEKGENESAMMILQALIKDGFNEFSLFDSLADIFRAKEEYDTAIKYYDKALEKFDEEIKPNKWATFFVRGISHDQSGNWEQAKVDLNTALRLYPNHPEVLNYFGYSLIERNERLDEALGMIEDAVEQKPDSGYIVDSLAWGLFRLGQYKEAIVPMEKAIELEPHDPIVNDHLGDILWMTGRKREASFQWNRALFFGPTQENEEKIKKKLIFGLTEL